MGRDTGAARESESLSQAELVLRGKCGSRHGWGANVLSDFPEMFPQRAGKGGEGKGGCAAAPRVNYYLAGKRGWWWCSHQNCYWFAFLVSVTPPIRADPALLYVLLAGDFQKCVQMEKKNPKKQTKPKLVLASRGRNEVFPILGAGC